MASRDIGSDMSLMVKDVRYAAQNGRRRERTWARADDVEPAQVLCVFRILLLTHTFFPSLLACVPLSFPPSFNLPIYLPTTTQHSIRSFPSFQHQSFQGVRRIPEAYNSKDQLNARQYMREAAPESRCILADKP